MASNVITGRLAVEDPVALRGIRRLSWGPIFAGVVIAIAVQVVLGILGTGIGLSMVDPTEGTTPGALGAGGYAAARVSGSFDRFDALIHGLTAAQRKIGRPDAQAQVDRAKADFARRKDATVEKAKVATDAAAGAVAGTSFMIVVALLVGAGAAAFGAIASTRRRAA